MRSGGNKRLLIWEIVFRQLDDGCSIFQPTNPNQIQIKEISKVAEEVTATLKN
jgi:hypothetical protein